MMCHLRERAYDAHRVLNKIACLAGQGVIGPIYPVTVHPMHQVAKAFRLLGSYTYTGKAVLSVTPDEQVQVFPRVPTPS